MEKVARPSPPILASARVVGGLNCLFGGLGVLWNPLVTGGVYVFSATDPADPWYRHVTTDPVYRGFLVVFIVMVTAACLVQVASGIGLLRGKRWGWTLGIGYAIFSLIAPVAEYLIDYVLATHQIILEAGRAGEEDAFVVQVAGTAFHIVYNIAMMIYPAILLYVLMRPDVRRAFAKRR
ncbi:MAG: hypothetical protein JWN86_3524 [Planctomycetota bacterium]|nr:hypothetical protein [Planctomycetota bacterium]